MEFQGSVVTDNEEARNAIIIEHCHFVLVALKAILKNKSCPRCVRIALNPSVLMKMVLENDGAGDVFIYLGKGNYRLLFVIRHIIRFRTRLRLIVIFDQTHIPLFQLMRCMGVRLMVSRRDKICHFQHVLCDSTLNDYMAPVLRGTFEKTCPHTRGILKMTLTIPGYYLRPQRK